MKKKLLILMTLCLCLMGCSSSSSDPTKSVTLGWKDGVITFDDKATGLTYYNGMSGMVDSGNGGITYRFSLDIATDVTNITVNTQQIIEENMNKYKGKFYYLEYLGSEFTMASNIKDDYWAICQASIGVSGLDPQLAATYASDYIDSFPLTQGAVYCDFGKFKFGNEYATCEIRSDGAVIQGVMKVTKTPHTFNDVTVVTQNEKDYTLDYESTKEYDIYGYDGFTIMCAKGLNLSEYITFK